MSSIGFGRSRPGTNNLHEYICFIRRALALDETRVKFLVEYLYGGESVPNDVATSMRDGILRVKEVWFSGSHSDVYVVSGLVRTVYLSLHIFTYSAAEATCLTRNSITDPSRCSGW